MNDELPVPRRLPLVARLDPAHPAYELVLARHERALTTGAPTYVDPLTGFEVLTAAQLWARGWCCDHGCRHCPFTDGPRGPWTRTGSASGRPAAPTTPEGYRP